VWFNNSKNGIKFISNFNTWSNNTSNYPQSLLSHYYNTCFYSIGLTLEVSGFMYNNRVCIITNNKIGLSKWRISRHSLKHYQPMIVGLHKAEW